MNATVCRASRRDQTLLCTRLGTGLTNFIQFHVTLYTDFSCTYFYFLGTSFGAVLDMVTDRSVLLLVHPPIPPQEVNMLFLMTFL